MGLPWPNFPPAAVYPSTPADTTLSAWDSFEVRNTGAIDFIWDLVFSTVPTWLAKIDW